MPLTFTHEEYDAIVTEISNCTVVGSLKYKMDLFHTLLQLIISLIRAVLVFTNYSLDYGWPDFILVITVLF
jgi:hypothetical protein